MLSYVYRALNTLGISCNWILPVGNILIILIINVKGVRCVYHRLQRQQHSFHTLHK
jgi:hypothetical protein